LRVTGQWSSQRALATGQAERCWAVLTGGEDFVVTPGTRAGPEPLLAKGLSSLWQCAVHNFKITTIFPTHIIYML